MRIEWHYIAPGKPTQNAFIESFNGRLRDELLNETLFTSLAQARAALSTLERRLQQDSARTARSAICAPIELRRLSVPRCNGTGAALCGGSAPRPVAPPSQQAQMTNRTLLITG